MTERPKREELPASVSYMGILLLMAAFFEIPAGGQFPGYLALVPVAGTVLLLLNGRADNPVNNLMSKPLPVFFGKISYSLYLWHWPILVLALFLRGHDIGLLEKALWLVLSILVATLSWRYIETPVRHDKRIGGKTVFGGTVLLSVFSLGLAGLIFKQDGVPSRFSDSAKVHINATADFLQDWSRCEVPNDGAFAGLEICPIGPEGEPQILIWGDSHLRAIREGLNLASMEQNVPGLVIWRAGCPPFFGIEKEETAATPSQNAVCGSANRQIETALKNIEGLKTVLLVGRWTYYWTGAGVGLDAHNKITVSASEDPAIAQPKALSQAAAKTVNALTLLGKAVFILQQPPEIPQYDSRITARAHALADLPFANTDAFATSVSRAEVMQRQTEPTLAWSHLETEGLITLIPTWDRICDAVDCFAVEGEIGQYFDNNHLTNSAALRLRNAFEPLFKGASQ